MHFLLMGVLVAMPAVAEPKVLLFSALGTPGEVVVSGRVLKYAPTGGSSTLSKNVRRLAASPWVGVALEVRFAGRSARVRSGHDGDFQVTIVAGEKPFEAGLQPVEAQVAGAIGHAVVDVVSPEAPFLVVSDFDDTVAVTNVTKVSGLVSAALLQDEATQPAVPGMVDWYACLRAMGPARPGLAFVSGSPEQYSGRIATFLARGGFPPAGLYLRNLGPSTMRGYKQPVLKALLSRFSQPLVLIGDSGEKDPEVYAAIRAAAPTRVRRIYIRNAGGPQNTERFSDMVRFTDAQMAARDAVAQGLADAACVKERFGP